MPPVAILNARWYFKILSVEQALHPRLHMSETKGELKVLERGSGDMREGGSIWEERQEGETH